MRRAYVLGNRRVSLSAAIDPISTMIWARRPASSVRPAMSARWERRRTRRCTSCPDDRCCQRDRPWPPRLPAIADRGSRAGRCRRRRRCSSESSAANRGESPRHPITAPARAPRAGGHTFLQESTKLFTLGETCRARVHDVDRRRGASQSRSTRSSRRARRSSTQQERWEQATPTPAIATAEHVQRARPPGARPPWAELVVAPQVQRTGIGPKSTKRAASGRRVTAGVPPLEIRRRRDQEPGDSAQAPRDQRRIGSPPARMPEVEALLDEVHRARWRRARC